MVLCIVLAVGIPPPPPPSPTFTSRPPDVIHVMNTSHLNFSPIFQFHVLLWMQTDDQNGGVLGPRLLYCHVSSWDSRILILPKLIIVTWVPYSPGACV